MIRTIRATCIAAALSAVTLIAGLAGGGLPAHAAASAPQQQWAQATPYQFASNPGGDPPLNGTPTGYPVINWWQVSNSPFSGSTSSTSSQSLGSNGVNLSIAPSDNPPDQGWASSGIVVPLGTIASSGLYNGSGLNALNVSGSPGLVENIIFDTNGDTQLFHLSGGTTGVLQSYGGDEVLPDTAGINSFDLLFAESPGQGINQGINTHIWAWISIAGGSAATGYVSSVDNQPLTVPAAAPVQNLTATAKYTNLTATWQPGSGDQSYAIYVTRHHGAVTVLPLTTPVNSPYTVHGLTQNTSYAVHVRAYPAAPGQQAATATVYVTTK